MNVFRDRFKAFKLHRVVFEFTDNELNDAVFTDAEESILKKKAETQEQKLERAYTIARGVMRGNNKK